MNIKMGAGWEDLASNKVMFIDIQLKHNSWSMGSQSCDISVPKLF